MFLIKCPQNQERPYLSAIMPSREDPLLVFTKEPEKALSFLDESSCKMFVAALNFSFDECYPFSYSIY